MSWLERLQDAAYTSPSGNRIVFDYEDVRKAWDKKTAAFTFPDANGTYVQDLGHSGRRYPLRVIFWGDDHDTEAEAFELALNEVGIGKLEHPIYQTIDVVPFGTITRRDDLKTNANQSIIEVTFWETIGLVYPASQADPASNILSAVDEYNASASVEFEDITSLETTVEQATFKSQYLNMIDNVKSGLQTVADVQENVQKEFDAIYNSINDGIDVLISEPLNLAFQTVLLIQSPARALANIEARLNAYKDLADLLLSGEGAAVQGLDSTNSNVFHAKDLQAATAITGSILSVVNNQFISKPEAIAAAESVIEQMDTFTEWHDDNYESLGEIDTGSAYQQLQEAVALTAGFLVEISFTLKQERRLILTSNRTVIDLVGFLYGSVDDQLDFFITSNNLSGSEILELPAGREIVYYV